MTKPTVTPSHIGVSFPAKRIDRDELIQPAPLRERGLSLRAAHDEDLPWLRDLYASTRAEEMAPVPWPDAAKRAFLDQQFDLQHRHFVSHFPGAEFWLVESAQGPIGRLYRDTSVPPGGDADDLIVDIGFLPSWRNQGLGSSLLRAVQASASARGRGVRLHVQVHNSRALNLYRRLGFVVCESADIGSDSHFEMRWSGSRLS